MCNEGQTSHDFLREVDFEYNIPPHLNSMYRCVPTSIIHTVHLQCAYSRCNRKFRRNCLGAFFIVKLSQMSRRCTSNVFVNVQL